MNLGYPERDASTCSVVFPFTGPDGSVDFETVTPITVWEQEDGLHATFATSSGVQTTAQVVAEVIPNELTAEQVATIKCDLHKSYNEAKAVESLFRLAMAIESDD